MLGLVCMFDRKGMKNGINSIKNFDLTKVTEAALFNLDYTLECIRYCMENKFIFRVSSAVIPYMDLWEWEKNEEILEKMAEIKKLSMNIRLIIHPDQFVVLNSEKEHVIENSMKILSAQGKLCRYMGIRHMIIHLGRMNAAKAFIDSFQRLPDEVKSILCLENCHYYKVDEVLEVCQILNLPMVLDVHHARITNSENYNLNAVKASWKEQKPLAHISSGKDSFLDKSHSDYISAVDIKHFFWLFRDFDVEIEAKKKENAVLKVKELLLSLPGGKDLDI